MIPEAGKYAWVTLSTEPEYLPGAVALARSLRQCHSEHRLIVMVTPASDASMIGVLESEGCEIRTVEPIVIQNSPTLLPGMPTYGRSCGCGDSKI